MTNRDEWLKHVAEWRASGMGAEEFSKQRGLSKARLWGWSSRVRKAERSAATEGIPPLARVVRRTGGRRTDSPVVVEWQGIRINLGVGSDRGTLVTVLQAVADLGQNAGRGVR